MALTTTCIGAYPKPDYLPIKDWFQVDQDQENYVDEVVRGYPNRIDDPDYPKADPGAYHQLAGALDGVVDQLSIEDSHRHNDLSLFAKFRKTKLVVGFIDVASSRLESVDEIEARMREVKQTLPEGHLIAAPDCGLGFLGRDLALRKLTNMCEAARRV